MILIWTISRFLMVLSSRNKIPMNPPIISDFLITLNITTHNIIDFLIRQVLILRLNKDGVTDLITLFDPVEKLFFHHLLLNQLLNIQMRLLRIRGHNVYFSKFATIVWVLVQHLQLIYILLVLSSEELDKLVEIEAKIWKNATFQNVRLSELKVFFWIKLLFLVLTLFQHSL